MNTLELEAPVQESKEVQFETLITNLRNAGYSLDTQEYNRLKREFDRGTYHVR